MTMTLPITIPDIGTIHFIGTAPVSSSIQGFIDLLDSIGLRGSIDPGKQTEKKRQKLKMKKLHSLIIFFLVAITGCASQPVIDSANYDASVLPNQVSENIGDYTEQAVIWGGVIVGLANQTDGTQLEILAYPLDSSQRPVTSSQSTGRFLITTDTFLEPVDYTAGKLVTTSGQISGLSSGTIGQTSIDYPTLRSDQLYLWSKRSSRIKPVFGIGVSFGF